MSDALGSGSLKDKRIESFFHVVFSRSDLLQGLGAGLLQEQPLFESLGRVSGQPFRVDSRAGSAVGSLARGTGRARNVASASSASEKGSGRQKDLERHLVVSHLRAVAGKSIVGCFDVVAGEKYEESEVFSQQSFVGGSSVVMIVISIKDISLISPDLSSQVCKSPHSNIPASDFYCHMTLDN